MPHAKSLHTATSPSQINNLKINKANIFLKNEAKKNDKLSYIKILSVSLYIVKFPWNTATPTDVCIVCFFLQW